MENISVKTKKRSFINQFYWQNIPDLIKKKPTCCQVGFSGFLGFSVLS